MDLGCSGSCRNYNTLFCIFLIFKNKNVSTSLLLSKEGLLNKKLIVKTYF
jgi:hypothetical protein